eukprot:1425954-Pyramimonas_sp.AAC.1
MRLPKETGPGPWGPPQDQLVSPGSFPTALSARSRPREHGNGNEQLQGTPPLGPVRMPGPASSSALL